MHKIIVISCFYSLSGCVWRLYTRMVESLHYTIYCICRNLCDENFILCFIKFFFLIEMEIITEHQTFFFLVVFIFYFRVAPRCWKSAYRTRIWKSSTTFRIWGWQVIWILFSYNVCWKVFYKLFLNVGAEEDLGLYLCTYNVLGGGRYILSSRVTSFPHLLKFPKMNGN